MHNQTSPEAKARAATQASHNLAVFLPFLRENTIRAVLAFLALIAAALATLGIPLGLRAVIDHGFTDTDPSTITRHFLTLGALVMLLAIASGTRYYLVTTLGERIITRLRTTIFAHLLTLDATFYDGEKTGELLSRMAADTTQLKATFGASASVALRNLLLFAGAIIMMLATSLKLSLGVFLAIPLVVLPLVFSGGLVRKRARTAQAKLADATAHAGEFLAGVSIVQGFGAERATGAVFTNACDEAFAAANSATRARAVLTTAAITLAFGSVVFVLWLGARDVLSGGMSGGALTQFVLFAAFGAGALGELSQLGSELSAARGAADRLAELLARQSAIASPAKPVVLPRAVDLATPVLECAGVTFAYKGAMERPVLQDFNIAIPRGKMAALVGVSGSGKSTLFKLLMRFYDPQAGEIRLDGVALPALDVAALRTRFALVPQEPTVFGTSILDNLRLGNPKASMEDITQAARDAAADAFISRLHDGYHTIIGERGVTLSGGERQRLAIARALLKNAPILLLDEATSAMDAENEALIQGALKRLMAGRTALVVAHRLSTVRDADVICVIEGGRVVAQGTHQDLMAKSGLYAKLARLQFLE